ncbi:MAG: phospho-sugar mutase [Rikenellaceae bacterium]
MIMELENYVQSQVEKWLEGNYSEETKAEIRTLQQENPQALVEAFYRNLEFGTGGLRGIMGVGTNRMNIYTVGMATQGLANYLKNEFKDTQIKVAVAYDSRNNSPLFGQTVSEIFAANGFQVYLFESLRPTPELSFAIRQLGCQSGVVVTASHNPKEYNGYKAYWSDGAQVIAPHDTNIIKEVEKITDVNDVMWSGNSENITMIGEDLDRIYLDKVLSLRLSPEAVAANCDIKIVYTPIHGTGTTLVPRILKECGFTAITCIEEQSVPDGNFPTVKSPNPEEASALKMATDKAEEIGADIVMATDPDADRIGIAIRNSKGEMTLMNGNQTGAILTYYLLKRHEELGKLTGKDFIVKTIVTSELFIKIAEHFNVDHYNVLTGFKFIADIIAKNEGVKNYIGGGEESYGYLAGDFVRDKDAVSASMLIAECAAWAKSQGMTLYDLLIDIYAKFGFFKEGLVSVVKEGKSGQEEIKAIMANYRENPLESVAGSKVVKIFDYKTSKGLDVVTGEAFDIDLPTSDVLQYLTEDGTIISMRPSGTEPKIKFYFGVKVPLASKDEFDAVNKIADDKIAQLKAELS